MCVICDNWVNGKITSKEAFKALGELIENNKLSISESEHYFELSEKILDSEVPVRNSDIELDKTYQDNIGNNDESE